MSQIYKPISSSITPIPPTVATSYDTDFLTTAVPALNVLQVKSIGFSASNVVVNPVPLNTPAGTYTNGLQTIGSSGAGNLLSIGLTNRFSATTTTSDGAGQSQTIFTFPLGAVAGAYEFDVKLVAYNVTDSLSSSYYYNFGCRTTGANAPYTANSSPLQFNEETTMSAVIVAPVINNGANTFTLTLTGIAAKVINWNVVVTFLFVS